MRYKAIRCINYIDFLQFHPLLSDISALLSFVKRQNFYILWEENGAVSPIEVV